MSDNRKSLKTILTSISIACVLWATYKLWTFDEWKIFNQHLNSNRALFPGLIIGQLALFALNISLEAGKWQLLTQHIRKLSFRQSLTQVVRGIQMGLITPARTGEPFGKTIFYPKRKRVEIVLLSLTGSILVNTVILATTAWAIFSFKDKHPYYLNFFSDNINTPLIIWTIAIFTLLLLLFFKLLPRFSRLKKFTKYLQSQLLTLKKVRLRNFFKAGILTIIRHMVFCLQFLILLQYFGLSDAISDLYLVFIFFGAITFLPSAGAGDLGIRATVALLVFGETTLTDPGIIMASMTLWFINIALPSVIPFFWKTTKKLWLLFFYKRIRDSVPST